MTTHAATAGRADAMSKYIDADVIALDALTALIRSGERDPDKAVATAYAFADTMMREQARRNQPNTLQHVPLCACRRTGAWATYDLNDKKVCRSCADEAEALKDNEPLPPAAAMLRRTP